MIPLQKYTTVGDNKKKSRNLTSRLSHQHKRDKKREQHPLDKLKPRQANISLVFSHLKTIRRQDIMCVCVCMLPMKIIYLSYGRLFFFLSLLWQALKGEGKTIDWRSSLFCGLKYSPGKIEEKKKNDESIVGEFYSFIGNRNDSVIIDQNLIVSFHFCCLSRALSLSFAESHEQFDCFSTKILQRG